MSSILARFYGEQGDVHPGPLTWPGDSAGFPVLGESNRLLKGDEIDEFEHVPVFKARAFLTWEPEQLAAYVDVMNRAASGWFRIRFVDRRFDSEHNGYRIWLEWDQIYAVDPKQHGPESGPSQFPMPANPGGGHGRPDQILLG